MERRFVEIDKREGLSRTELGDFLSYMERHYKADLVAESIPLGELSGRIENNFITPEDEPVPDCLSCGACCTLVYHVNVRSDDPTPQEAFWKIQLSGTKRPVTVEHVLRRDPRDGRCRALEGNVGESIGCRIYENRPHLCRRFDAGSDKCHALRRARGIEPPLTDQETATALLNLIQREEKDDPRIIIHAAYVETEDADKFELVVYLENDTHVSMGRFVLGEVPVLESDFITLTVDEARSLLADKIND